MQIDERSHNREFGNYEFGDAPRTTTLVDRREHSRSRGIEETRGALSRVLSPSVIPLRGIPCASVYLSFIK